MPNVPSQGWAVEVTHPVTNRTIAPQVLSRPQILRSLNSLPEIRIPVKPSASWLDDGFDDNPTMDVWLDGEKQAIDELRRVEDEQGQTVLVGIGGVELRQRVEQEYRSEERHVAARDLVDNNTSYGTDVDTPTFTTLQDRSQQDVSTTTEFSNNTNVSDTDPFDLSGDQATVYQTSWTQEGEIEGQAANTNVSFSDGEAAALSNNGQTFSWTFTPNYTIPIDDFEVGIRFDASDIDPGTLDIKWTLDGTQISVYSPGSSSLQWTEDIISTSNSNNRTADVDDSQHTLTAEVTAEDPDGDQFEVDVVQPYDTGGRYSYGPFSYTYDNTVHQDNGYLDGPGTHPNFARLEGLDTTTAFRYVEGTATVSMNDTTRNQSLQLSGDSGATWNPTNGDEDNTTTVTVDFSSSPTATLRLRIYISNFSPSGTRNQTPRENYDAQTVSDWEITADVQEQRLLIDQTFDDALVSILNDIAGELEDYIWSYNLDASGNPQVSWTQPGARTAASDPDFSDLSIEKDTDTWPKFTIKGSNKGISEETFSASSSFVDLTESNIVPNSESVYDPTTSPTTQFDRDSDYQMDYSGGQIKTTNGSAMTNGTDYQIDYDAEVRGTYTDPNAGMNPDERVESVPAVNSASSAEQVAWSLVQDFKDPRWSGSAVVPKADPTFDPLDALPLNGLDLPSAATPLEISGSPEETPEGLRYRLGSDTQVAQALSAIGGQLRSVSKRV